MTNAELTEETEFIDKKKEKKKMRPTNETKYFEFKLINMEMWNGGTHSVDYYVLWLWRRAAHESTAALWFTLFLFFLLVSFRFIVLFTFYSILFDK